MLTEEASHGYFPGDDLFAVSRPTGLLIGNLTSQFFANVLLDQVDHFIKEELRVPGYVRYADDLVLFADEKDDLWSYRDALAERLSMVRLRLHRDKTRLGRGESGLKFLGFVLQPTTKRLQQSVLARFNRRLRHMQWQYSHGRIDLSRIRLSLQAWSAHARRANSAGVRRQIWRRVRFRKERLA